MTEIEFIRAALEDVSVYARARYDARADVEVSNKADENDLVTEVDIEIQRRLAERIREEFPGDQVIGEELGMNTALSEDGPRCWVLDPIDGTQNFVRGIFPAFGISIAFVQGNQTQAGGISMPIISSLFLAERGAGATRNEERISVTPKPTLALSRTEIDFASQDLRGETLRRFSEIITASGQMRCHCAAVVGLCSVATGDAESYFHVKLHPWDYAGASLIVEEAGGRISRLDGSPVYLNDEDQSLVATNGHIHEECLAIVAKTA